MHGMNQARDNLLTTIGASTDSINRQAILNMPQGDYTPIDKLILQFPGVSYDSAASNPNFHIRSEYANYQTRINGVVVPEGVSGLGRIPRHEFYRQHISAYGSFAGGIRPAHCRRARHHQPQLRHTGWTR